MEREDTREFLASGSCWTAHLESPNRRVGRRRRSDPLPYITPGIRFVSDLGDVRFLPFDAPKSDEYFRSLTARELADLLERAR